MSETKILTLAALGVVLAGLIEQSKSLKIGPSLAAFGDDFKAFCDQPKDLDQVLIKQLQGELETKSNLIDKYVADQEVAKGVIGTLKGQLKAAQEVKAGKTDKPGFELGGVKYVINHGAHPHSIADIQKSPDLQSEILAIEGQNAISKL
jgi:hypothetical protein